MKLGEKIRQARLNAGLTQAELAGDFITRNMLSQIENSLAMPSLQTAMYIADKLGIDAGILLSDGDDSGAYFFTRKLPEIKRALVDGDCDRVIELCQAETCDEAYLILGECYIKKAYQLYDRGKLRQSLKAAESAVKYASRGFYSSIGVTLGAEMLEEMISAVMPSLRQSRRSDEEKAYLVGRFIERFADRELIDRHNEARRLIDGKKYESAMEILKDILRGKEPSVPFLYTVYCDLEVCCRELNDYENAYKYSQTAKRMFGEMQQ